MNVEAEPLSLLRERTSLKWQAFPDDVLPLFVAELDYPLAEPIRDALFEAVRRSDTGYAASAEPLAQAFAAFAARRWGWPVDPGQVVATNEVGSAVVEVLRMILEPGDEVVITPPVYPPFFDLVPEAGGRVVDVPLLHGQTGWTLDLDGLEAALRRGARAVLLCNPQNPLGHPHGIEDLTALAELADRYGAFVVSDEVNAPLAYSAESFTPYLTVSPAAAQHGVCVTSASTAWNLAGLTCALIVTASERMRLLTSALPPGIRERTGHLGLLASTTAFRDGGPWLDGALAALQANRGLLAGLLDAHLGGVGYEQPRAGYLAWLDLRSLGWGDDPAAVALERAKVALLPGLLFGTPGAGFARLNFGCSPEVLSEAVSRIAAAT
ncbi:MULTISPECIES: MalY/PatB family protein [unclassified Cryobacterium]|uniref:MalY/PatB family protein n=1 Tax=unclassified Cryobacterium TaxID=2649013 RepID=UPI00106D39B3|nr:MULTISPECIES: aminotransferase class I/II-fold pyridoxal phosphate-dependent enzyme [unclassified Cryobacterium]TFB98460.1 aminotransferase class I/II-fold pyridoxal phosphate-dependent enzyme [Cryobacterium sp. MDB2-A-1]TFC08342.1 aminotransferase class I/II-fold pyridoxal phosphate-dependent enzyme [Cryobacterium sp. MDB2-33-2]TFC08609.1 aminotransferase class I/II-fold pyridoxal phosphate-dependent enzyme [Cryobacterium sp. MDB2-A-2]TFC22335.1 aminotransferase class I/II-fold pyridoxal ph